MNVLVKVIHKPSCPPYSCLFLSLLNSSPSHVVCHLHMSRNMHCAVDSLHTGTCQANLFHAGSVVATLYLCFCLAALTSSRHVKCSKNNDREGTTNTWHNTRGLPASRTLSLLWPPSSNVLMLNLTSGNPAGLIYSHVQEHHCLAVKLYL